LPTTGLWDERKFYDDRSSRASPDIKIVSLEFDNLEIPFEKVFESSEQTLREKFLELLADLELHVSNLSNIVSIDRREVRFSYARLNSFTEHKALLEKFKTAIDGANAERKKELSQVHEMYLAILKAVSPSDHPDFQRDLLMPNNYGLKSLEKDLDRLKRLSSRLLDRSDGGKDMEKVVTQVEQDFTTSNKIFRFYEQVIQTLRMDLGAGGTIPSLVKSLKSISEKGESENVQSKLKKLIQNLHRLMSERKSIGENLSISLPIMNSVDWGKTLELNEVVKKKLTITIQGKGKVTSTNFPDVSCPPQGSEERTCQTELSLGASVILEGSDGSFTGWSRPSCTGNEPCTIIMSEDQNITATFSDSSS